MMVWKMVNDGLENLPKPSPSKHGQVQQHITFIRPANLFTHFIAKITIIAKDVSLQGEAPRFFQLVDIVII